MSDAGEHECPTCGDEFPTNRGVKSHYGQVHDGSIAGVERVCDTCGDEFTVSPCRVDSARFCSDGCKFGRKIKCECDNCGETLYRKECRFEKTDKQFCDADCQGAWVSENNIGEQSHSWKERVVRDCANCGEPVARRPSYPDDLNWYCSARCRRENTPRGEDHWCWEGGTMPYGAGWNEEKKRRVRIRDQARCQQCGRAEPEHIEQFGEKHVVHHVRKARHIDDPEERNAMANLVTLCRGQCHRTWEKMSPLQPVTDVTTVE